MNADRCTVYMLTILLSILFSSHAGAVTAISGDYSLPADIPEAYSLLGGISETSASWQPSPKRDDASEWQSFRYNSNDAIAFAAGVPFPLTENPDENSILTEDALRFVQRLAAELYLEGCDADVVSIRSVRGITVIHLQPQVNDIPVYGGYVVLSVNSDGALAMLKSRGFGSNVTGSFSLTDEQAVTIARNAVSVFDGEGFAHWIYLPIRQFHTTDPSRQSELEPGAGNLIELRACYEVILEPDDPGFRPVLFVDGETGEVIAAEDRIYYDRFEGTMRGWYKPLYSQDESVRAPFAYEWIRMERYGDHYTDVDGLFEYDIDQQNLPLRLFTELRGRFVNVDYEDGDDAQLIIEIDSVEPHEITWMVNQARHDERSLYYHVNFIHDFWKQLDHGFDALDYPLTAMCMYGQNFDNAFWNGQGIYFGDGNEMDNFALYADIVYHEYGHAVTSGIYPRGVLPYVGESGALNEAWSDYFPCSITDEPYMGEGGLRFGGYIRLIDNDLVYPDDIRHEVHLDSRIFSAAMWHSRELLGRDVTDPLFHFARYELGNDFIIHFTDILLTDDDDGDITNGTPNDWVLYEQFGRHGIGPGVFPKITVADLRLYDDETDGAHGNDDRVWEPGETIRMVMDLFREGVLYPPKAENVRVSFRSDHEGVIPVRDEIGYGDMGVGDRRSSDVPLLFQIAEDAELSFAHIYLTTRSDRHELIRRDTLRIPLGRPEVLLVKDGDEYRDRTHYFEQALDDLGQVYSGFSTTDPILPLLNRLNGIETVIWFSGDASEGILQSTDRAALSDFLDNNGNLFMTGQSLGSSPGAEDFFNQYLGVEHEIDSLHQVWIEGVEDDPVARGLNLLLLGADGAQNQYRPAAIAAIEPAVEIYHWTRYEGQPASGVRRLDPETGSRTVYFSFGFEAIGGHGGTANRNEVLNNILTWFDIETTAGEIELMLPSAFQLGTPYPNPFNHAISIPFRLETSGEVSLSVYDLTGREVWSGARNFATGQAVWTVSGNRWGSGIYFIKAAANGGSGTAKVVLVK
ncbi:T9SS type A sorting domain-containing protein [bacterium]|nr:T9SS type A sorting domain-containing protein [bacterium]